MVQRFANASAKRVGGRAELDWPPEDELTPRRVLLANVLPLAMSLVSVGIVTAGMLLLERPVALSLVPASAIVAIVVSATAGALVESVLGATLEGPGILNNDMLNFINTAVAAVVAIAIT